MINKNLKRPISEFDKKSKHYRDYVDRHQIDSSDRRKYGWYSLTIPDGFKLKTYFFNYRIRLMRLRKLIYLSRNNFELNKEQMNIITAFEENCFIEDLPIFRSEIDKAIERITRRHKAGGVELTCKRRKITWQ